MSSLDILEKRIQHIEERNLRVEADKAWETSVTRKILVAVLTYIVIALFFFVASLPDPLVNAIVPAVAFLLSTLTVTAVKNWWISNQR